MFQRPVEGAEQPVWQHTACKGGASKCSPKCFSATGVQRAQVACGSGGSNCRLLFNSAAVVKPEAACIRAGDPMQGSSQQGDGSSPEHPPGISSSLQAAGPIGARGSSSTAAEDEFGNSDAGCYCRPSNCRLVKIQPADGDEELLHRWQLQLCNYCSKGSTVWACQCAGHV